MIDRIPSKTAAREARRRRRLGPDAACILCGESNLVPLKSVEGAALDGFVRNGLLERHHVLGRKIDSELVIVLCLSCHAKATESLRRGGSTMEQPDTFLDRLINALMAFGAFLHDALCAVERWVQDALQFARWLDEQLPGWRERWKTSV